MNETKRHEGIDVFRYIAFLAIAVLHCLPSYAQGGNTAILINHATRFAVPFFFVCSGYFIGLKNYDSLPGTIKYFKRLAPIFLFWIFFYLCFFNSFGEFLKHRNLHSLIAPAGSAFFHLWFLPALGISIVLLLWFKRFGIPVLAVTAAALYVFGMAFGSYREFLHLPDIGFNTRNGPFFGFPLIFAGYYLARSNKVFSLRMGILIALAGLGVQILEACMMAHAAGDHLQAYNYTIGTFFFGTGMFITSINLPEQVKLNTLARLGSLTLGMYCIHVAFLRFLEPYIDRAVLYEDLALIGFVIIAATISTLILARIPYLKAVVK